MAATLSPGQTHESQSLQELIEGAEVTGYASDVPLRPVQLAGDKGYRANWIDQWLLGEQITPVIPSYSNEDPADRAVPFDRDSYRRRSIIEQLIGWLKECRRVATRFEKRAIHYLSMVKLAMIQRYLRLMCP